MKSQTFESLGSAAPVGRWLYAALLIALLIASLCTLAGQATEPKTGPAEPAAPQVQERDVRSLAEEVPVKKWKPGDPVRVVPDLREGGEVQMGEGRAEQQPPKPIVGGPVAPQVMERSVNELSTVEPYREGEPVRIVPDLKESNPKD